MQTVVIFALTVLRLLRRFPKNMCQSKCGKTVKLEEDFTFFAAAYC